MAIQQTGELANGPLSHKIPAVAQRLNVGRTTVYSMIKSDELRTIKVGGCMRISEAEIQRYMAKLEGRPIDDVPLLLSMSDTQLARWAYRTKDLSARHSDVSVGAVAALHEMAVEMKWSRAQGGDA